MSKLYYWPVCTLQFEVCTAINKYIHTKVCVPTSLISKHLKSVVAYTFFCEFFCYCELWYEWYGVPPCWQKPVWVTQCGCILSFFVTCSFSYNNVNDKLCHRHSKKVHTVHDMRSVLTQLFHHCASLTLKASPITTPASWLQNSEET